MTQPIMHGNDVQWDKREDGKWGWRIIALGSGATETNIIATDGGQGYEREEDCLAGLFRVFFGAYTPTFLAAHSRWVALGGDDAEKPEPFVRTLESDRDAIAYVEPVTLTPADGASSHDVKPYRRGE